MKIFKSIKSFPLLETERLHLREFNKNDIDFLHELRTSETVTEMAGIKKYTSLAETEELMNKILTLYSEEKGVWWLLSLKHENTPIGYAGIWNVQAEHLKGELGYMLLPYYFNKGYMSEALKVIIDFAFNSLSLHRLEAYIDSTNNNSINLLKKFNFIQEAFLREDFIFKGMFRDSVILAKLNYKN